MGGCFAVERSGFFGSLESYLSVSEQPSVKPLDQFRQSPDVHMLASMTDSTAMEQAMLELPRVTRRRKLVGTTGKRIGATRKKGSRARKREAIELSMIYPPTHFEL